MKIQQINNEDIIEKTKAIDSKDSKKRKISAKKVQVGVIIFLLVLSVILNVSAWFSTPFCDFWNGYILPIFTGLYGRFSSLFDFSFGEILIMIAVFGIPLSLVVMIVLLIILKGKRKNVGKIFALIYAWIFTFICVTETFNCFIMYHCSTFAELNDIKIYEHTDEQLENLGWHIVENLNSLAGQVPRDEDGYFVLTADLEKTAQNSMRNLGSEFANLGGYYVKPKPIACSFFMSQMDLTGIYFPFSMEANYNNDMYKAKLANTVCHELAHTKGYIQEDEANFIAFMACVRSEDLEYQYSGWLSALTYVRNKIFEYASEDLKVEFDSAISELVWNDITANSEYWKSVREAEDTVFDSEAVGEISEKALETNLQLNGVEDGMKSYGRMVDLMLNYYDKKGGFV